jgi:hypothetical protein
MEATKSRIQPFESSKLTGSIQFPINGYLKHRKFAGSQQIHPISGYLNVSSVEDAAIE